jgi:hypothetical protein
MHRSVTQYWKRRNPRRWLAVFAALALLANQWAVMSYACALEGSDSTVRGHVLAHGAPQCHQTPDSRNPGLCLQHCHPTPPTADHGKVPDVPPLALAAALPAPATIASASARHVRAVDHARSTSPPLIDRYCRYLI